MNTNQIFKRYEFKYEIPRYFVPGIAAFLRCHGMQLDPSAAKKPGSCYTVTSLYFDSPTLSDYNDKAGGFLSRKKIRVRIYEPFLNEDTKEIWLEKKAKYNMWVAKKRILLSHENYKELLNGSRANLLRQYNANPYAAEIIEHIVREQMKPQLITRYQRIPFITGGPADFRITLDTNIETCFSRDLCHTPSMKMVGPDMAVMEVKFSTILPSWFKTMLHRHELNRISFSKYANAMEKLRMYNPIPR